MVVYTFDGVSNYTFHDIRHHKPALSSGFYFDAHAGNGLLFPATWQCFCVVFERTVKSWTS